MKKISLTTTLMIALAGTAALAGCKKNEPTPAPAPEMSAPAPMSEPAPAAPAASVTSVTVGNTIGADQSVAPMATLGTKDKIVISVKTNGTAANVNLAAKLTYQDGQVAGEQSRTLNTTDTGTTNIEFANTNAWPAGKYRADVTLDGQPAGMTQEFEVK
ncbi:MAG: hypothetical protein J0H45_06760 [Stenotrophomonas nitritireducens]|uniref:Lipoprotein n=1 Tax=Stenotrophomonas nitritireducens TaxID=83617 RepID=A0A9D8KY48_9GAMM|nr:hypothetical protein [Stenotrophomonas nitritireducens]